LEVLNKRAYAVAVFVDGYPHAGRRRWDRPRAHRVTQLALDQGHPDVWLLRWS
jgi:hypothetical protein